MSRQEDFDVAAKKVARTKRTADAQAQCEYDFTLGCEYGYEYAVEKACAWLKQHSFDYMVRDMYDNWTYDYETMISDICKAMQ